MPSATLQTPSKPNGSRPRSQGHKVIQFIQENCVHPDGEWLGRPFKLEDWQRRLIMALFEVEDAGQRRYRWALLGLPKKNGKTTIAAALGLYFLIADGEPSPLVICAAASDDQADLVFSAAKRMCELSPTLSQLTERFSSEILVPSVPGARLKRVSAKAGTNDGQNIHVVICDELHEWTENTGRPLWNVLTNGTGARRQPMVLQITTAGYDKETICGEQYDYGKRVRAGELEDRRYFFHWQEAPPGMDHRDPAYWAAANPNLGVTVQAAFFEDQLSKKTESTFRRYFGNEWVAAEDIWIPYGVWDACKSALELDESLPLRVGIDLSNNQDATAVVAAQMQGERVVVRAKVWENPYPDGHAQRDSWKVNTLWVRDWCRELSMRFPVAACAIDDQVMRGPEFLYDPWNFRESAAELAGEGLAMVEHPQTDARMIPASQALYELIVKGRIAHDGDSVLARHVNNVTADQKPRGWRISKPRGSKRHIDAAVAMAMAASRALDASPQLEPSIYESRGLLLI